MYFSKTNKRGCLNIFTRCFFFVNTNYFLSFHTIVLISCKTINLPHHSCNTFMVIFLQQLKMYDLSWAGHSLHSVAVIHEECNLQKKNNNNELRNFIGSLNILGFLWSLVNQFIVLWIYCASRSPAVMYIYKQLCITNIKMHVLNVNTCFLVYESIAFFPLKLDYLATVMFV